VAKFSNFRAVAAVSLNGAIPSLLNVFLMSRVLLVVGESSSRCVGANTFLTLSCPTYIGSERLSRCPERFMGNFRLIDSKCRPANPLPGVQSRDLVFWGVAGVVGNMKSSKQIRSGAGTLSEVLICDTDLGLRAFFMFAFCWFGTCGLVWVSGGSIASLTSSWSR